MLDDDTTLASVVFYYSHSGKRSLAVISIISCLARTMPHQDPRTMTSAASGRELYVDDIVEQ